MRRWGGVAVLLAMVLVAGCGNDDGGEVRGDPEEPTVTTAVEVFDPDPDGEDDDPSSSGSSSGSGSGPGAAPADCVPDSTESDAVQVRSLVECLVPEVADDVLGASVDDGGALVDVTFADNLDADEVLALCEATLTASTTILDLHDDPTVTATRDFTPGDALPQVQAEGTVDEGCIEV